MTVTSPASMGSVRGLPVRSCWTLLIGEWVGDDDEDVDDDTVTLLALMSFVDMDLLLA
jgi:hypothetical protein